MTARRFATLPCTAIVCLLACVFANASDWPQFRGPNSQSHTDEKDLSTTWSKDSPNILWKSPLPKSDNGFSSPIVCNGRVFVTTVVNKPLAHTVLCFDKADGKELWQTPIDPGRWKLTDLRGGYGASTPAADKDHVFVVFGSAVIASLDYEGKLIWRKELKNVSFDVAVGTSPILFGDTVILQADQNAQKSSLIAFDKATGEIKWEKPRPEVIFAHSTPVVTSVDGKPQLVVSGSNSLQGIDPTDGKTIWSVESAGETASAAVGNGLAYVDTGRGGGGVCVDFRGPAPDVKWKAGAGQMKEGLGSPLIVDDLLYRMHNGDLLLCRKAATGETVFAERLAQASSWPSPFSTADHLIYFASAGKSYVLKAGPKLEIIATNDLGDLNPAASPAVSDGKIFLRGQKFLYCIGK